MLDSAKVRLIKRARDHARALDEIFTTLRLYFAGSPAELLHRLTQEQTRLEGRWQRKP